MKKHIALLIALATIGHAATITQTIQLSGTAVGGLPVPTNTSLFLFGQFNPVDGPCTIMVHVDGHAQTTDLNTTAFTLPGESPTLSVIARFIANSDLLTSSPIFMPRIDAVPIPPGGTFAYGFDFSQTLIGNFDGMRNFMVGVSAYPGVDSFSSLLTANVTVELRYEGQTASASAVPDNGPGLWLVALFTVGLTGLRSRAPLLR